MDAGKWLKRLLQITGWLMATAVFAIFLPHDAMGAIHERLGLGNFPEGKIVDYLARSTSAFYAMIGVLYIILARDLRVYAAIITFIAWANIAFGILLTATGLFLQNINDKLAKSFHLSYRQFVPDTSNYYGRYGD